MTTQTTPERRAAVVAPVELLPESGELCALFLATDLTVLEASKGCRHLFELSLEQLVGKPLSTLLDFREGFPGGASGVLDASVARSKPASVRLYWSRVEDGIHVLLLDVERACRLSFGESAALARFASMINHEVRNPLSSIKMVIQTLARLPNLDERGGRRLAIAAREIRTLERILTALSELARSYPQINEPAVLSEVLAEAVQVSEPELRDRGLSIRVVVATNLPTFYGDPERLRFALSHLLSQAAHSAKGSTITLSLSREGDEAHLRVLGLQQAAEATPRDAALSLAMVDKIARAHGGSFKLESSDHTSAYRLVLPLGPRSGASA
jgi:signal transduction histidine kinase